MTSDLLKKYDAKRIVLILTKADMILQTLTGDNKTTVASVIDSYANKCHLLRENIILTSLIDEFVHHSNILILQQMQEVVVAEGVKDNLGLLDWFEKFLIRQNIITSEYHLSHRIEKPNNYYFNLNESLSSSSSIISNSPSLQFGTLLDSIHKNLNTTVEISV
jgi:hypothetical protein